MKKCIAIFLVLPVLFACNDISTTDKTVEPFFYSEDFETNELSAWASYPLWQDTAFDPNMRVDSIAPGDTNLSIVQKVTPYTHVDNYAGAQKKFDAYMVSGSTIKLRYYLKTELDPEFFKIRLAAGPDGKVDYTVANPETNKWVWIEADYHDFIRQNAGLAKGKIKVNALAVLAKFPKADPAMIIYLGIDDVELKGARKIPFTFTEPEMADLSEWKPSIPKKHYQKGETFSLKGTWPVDADRVSLEITPFTDRKSTILSKDLNGDSNEWDSEFKLTFPEGLYLATLEAYGDSVKLSDTQFTIFIKPDNLGGSHPRLWFDEDGRNRVISRLNSTRFKNIKEQIGSYAKKSREENPVESIVYDTDQFPGADIHPADGLPNIRPWFARIHQWRSGVYNSALAYHLLGDKEAGKYGKNLLVKISGFPCWLHPWWKERGQHIYYPIGEMAMGFAMGYDLLFDIMSEEEREQVRNALTEQIVRACHKGYVEDDLVTNNTSNWVAHITGGSMMCQAAMYGDDDQIESEPYFTGVILKAYDMIQKSFGGDGAYGEGYGYYNFTMSSLSKSLPAMDLVFNIDMSERIKGSYNELIWAGNVMNKKTYYFGDSRGELGPFTNWAWLLAKHKDPLLGWFYNHLKQDETMMDVLYETRDVPVKDPFDEHPVKFFREVGTTVFKSGWEKDDFIFVMRTGAFYNHQHLDQGSFWLSDRGSRFIEERHGSTYYLDHYYQSWYTQPVAHSTILIDHNQQSQRVGDPLVFADGFHDHATLHHFLDGSDVAFSSGEMGKLYWGKVKQMSRNVLYLKPRTLLMLDVIHPTEEDVDVTQLYQTNHLKDIHDDQQKSTITKGLNVLHIKHLYPGKLKNKAVETPHYINTLLNEKPLVKEGMLTVTAHTEGKPLVMANVLTTTEGEEPEIEYQNNNGYVSGVANGSSFLLSTNPGDTYNSNNFITDALTLTWDNEKIFAAIVTSLQRDGKRLIASDIPITFEINQNAIKYYHQEEAEVLIGVDSEPASVTLDGTELSGWIYDEIEGEIKTTLPPARESWLFTEANDDKMISLKRMKRPIFLSLMILVLLIPRMDAEVLVITPQEETQWLRHLIPLPHEIELQRKIIMKPTDISIIVPKDASNIERNAAAELEELFKRKTGTAPNGNEFSIIIGIANHNGELNGHAVNNFGRIRTLQNRDQAYIIQTYDDNTLILTALNGKGVYYAAVTLCQLIEPFMTSDKVTIPLANVLDWPDMAERGLWNFPDPERFIPWLSSMKLNYGKMVNTKIHMVVKGKENFATIDKELMMNARLTAFNYLPFITHFNFLHTQGLFRAYPELAGVGNSALAGRYFAHKTGNQHRAPCTSQPLFTEILTQWMMDIASQGADEVSCWLSERPVQCGCDECTAVGQFVLEARACVNAWSETRKTYPDFIIRLFISTTTDERYHQVFAETPAKVRLERCCANWIERVSHLPRDLLVNPLFDYYAAQGRWIASYDVPLGAYGRVDTPEYKVPSSTAHRIRDFIDHLMDRKYQGAYGMLAWSNLAKETYNFNINALAEWSWNKSGRTEKEFATAWATREGYADPEAVSEWSEIMGPVEFDVYDSEFPVCYSWGQATQMINECTRPVLGEGLFRYYTSQEDFDAKIEACNRALEIARKFDNPYLANETAVVRSYVKLAQAIYLIVDQVATDDLSTLDVQKDLMDNINMLKHAGKENASAITAWRSELGPEPWHQRVHDAIKGTERTVSDISQIIQGKYIY